MNLHPKPAQKSILCEDSKVSTQDPKKLDSDLGAKFPWSLVVKTILKDICVPSSQVGDIPCETTSHFSLEYRQVIAYTHLSLSPIFVYFALIHLHVWPVHWQTYIPVFTGKLPKLTHLNPRVFGQFKSCHMPNLRIFGEMVWHVFLGGGPPFHTFPCRIHGAAIYDNMDPIHIPQSC